MQVVGADVDDGHVGLLITHGSLQGAERLRQRGVDLIDAGTPVALVCGVELGQLVDAGVDRRGVVGARVHVGRGRAQPGAHEVHLRQAGVGHQAVPEIAAEAVLGGAGLRGTTLGDRIADVHDAHHVVIVVGAVGDGRTATGRRNPQLVHLRIGSGGEVDGLPVIGGQPQLAVAHVGKRSAVGAGGTIGGARLDPGVGGPGSGRVDQILGVGAIIGATGRVLHQTGLGGGEDGLHLGRLHQALREGGFGPEAEQLASRHLDRDTAAGFGAQAGAQLAGLGVAVVGRVVEGAPHLVAVLHAAPLAAAAHVGFQVAQLHAGVGGRVVGSGEDLTIGAQCSGRGRRRGVLGRRCRGVVARGQLGRGGFMCAGASRLDGSHRVDRARGRRGRASGSSRAGRARGRSGRTGIGRAGGVVVVAVRAACSQDEGNGEKPGGGHCARDFHEMDKSVAPMSHAFGRAGPDRTRTCSMQGLHTRNRRPCRLMKHPAGIVPALRGPGAG